MKYNVVSSVEFTYPDIWDYPSSAQVIDTFAPGGNLLFQCYISNMECMGNREIINEEARKYGADYSVFSARKNS